MVCSEWLNRRAPEDHAMIQYHGMSRLLGVAWMSGLLLATPVTAQPSTGPDRQVLEQSLQLGTLATLAPLCGLRAESWAFDLRRAAIMEATRGSQPDDSALQAAPGRGLVEGALGFAEMEALESFAEAPAEKTCGPLANDPELTRADGIVRSFRALRDGKPES